MFRPNEASWGWAFSNRLSKLLGRKGIKIADFARTTGIPKSVLDNCIKNGKIPNYYCIMLMAEALDMTVERLTDTSPDADLRDLEAEYGDDFDFEEDCEVLD